MKGTFRASAPGASAETTATPLPSPTRRIVNVLMSAVAPPLTVTFWPFSSRTVTRRGVGPDWPSALASTVAWSVTVSPGGSAAERNGAATRTPATPKNLLDHRMTMGRNSVGRNADQGDRQETLGERDPLGLLNNACSRCTSSSAQVQVHKLKCTSSSAQGGRECVALEKSGGFSRGNKWENVRDDFFHR